MSTKGGDGAELAKEGLAAAGVGLVAAGVGAVVGVAAERLVIGRRRPAPDTQDYGSVRAPSRIVLADDGTKLYVEVEELPVTAGAQDGGKRGSVRQNSAPAPTLIFCHGYALTMDTWHFQRLALRGRYRMVFWDQRGHGRSSIGPEGHSTIDQLGSDLADVIESVAPQGPIVLIGHSMGGMTVMSLAARRPDLVAERVVGVGFVATSAGGLNHNDLGLAGLGGVILKVAPGTVKALTRTPRFVAGVRRLGNEIETALVRRYSYASPVSDRLLKFTAKMILDTPLDVIADFLPTFLVHDKRAALAAYTQMPSLVIVGDHDLLTPPEHSDEIAARLPRSRHVVVPHGGHIVLMEHPQAVTAALDELLVQVGQEAQSVTRRR